MRRRTNVMTTIEIVLVLLVLGCCADAALEHHRSHRGRGTSGARGGADNRAKRGVSIDEGRQESPSADYPVFITGDRASYDAPSRSSLTSSEERLLVTATSGLKSESRNLSAVSRPEVPSGDNGTVEQEMSFFDIGDNEDQRHVAVDSNRSSSSVDNDPSLMTNVIYRDVDPEPFETNGTSALGDEYEYIEEEDVVEEEEEEEEEKPTSTPSSVDKRLPESISQSTSEHVVSVTPPTGQAETSSPDDYYADYNETSVADGGEENNNHDEYYYDERPSNVEIASPDDDRTQEATVFESNQPTAVATESTLLDEEDKEEEEDKEVVGGHEAVLDVISDDEDNVDDVKEESAVKADSVVSYGGGDPEDVEHGYHAEVDAEESEAALSEVKVDEEVSATTSTTTELPPSSSSSSASSTPTQPSLRSSFDGQASNVRTPFVGIGAPIVLSLDVESEENATSVTSLPSIEETTATTIGTPTTTTTTTRAPTSTADPSLNDTRLQVGFVEISAASDPIQHSHSDVAAADQESIPELATIDHKTRGPSGVTKTNASSEQHMPGVVSHESDHLRLTLFPDPIVDPSTLTRTDGNDSSDSDAEPHPSSASLPETNNSSKSAADAEALNSSSDDVHHMTTATTSTTMSTTMSTTTTTTTAAADNERSIEYMNPPEETNEKKATPTSSNNDTIGDDKHSTGSGSSGAERNESIATAAVDAVTVRPSLLPAGFSTEEPVSVLLVPLKSRNVSRGRNIGNLFDEILRRQKVSETDIPIATERPPSHSSRSPAATKSNVTVADKLNATSNVAKIKTGSANVNSSSGGGGEIDKKDNATDISTIAPRTSLISRRRFPQLSRKPFLATRSGPAATRAPFKIATGKTSDILRLPRPSLKPIGRRPHNSNSQVEYPSDPDSRTDSSAPTLPPTTTTPRVVTTLSPYFLWGMSVEVACTLKVLDGANWTMELEDHGSAAYKLLSNDIQKELDDTYRKSPVGHRFKGTQIEGFSRGSIIVDYTLYLTEANDEPVDRPLLWEAISKSLDNGTDIGPYTIDPGSLSFEVVRKITPPPEIAANAELLIPHWAIAIIVIVTATLLFLVILCVAMTRNRRGAKRKYGNPLRDDSAIVADRARTWEKTAYDNLSTGGGGGGGGGNGGGGSLYDINDTWDEKKLKQQQRNSYSQYNNMYGGGNDGQNVLYGMNQKQQPLSPSQSPLPPPSSSSASSMDKKGVGMNQHVHADDYSHRSPHEYGGRYYDSWRDEWSRSNNGTRNGHSKPPDYDTTF